MPVLRRAEETPAASKKEALVAGPPDTMIAFQPAETFVHR
jgi:hypothetical protein